jgi:hypothetical protein
VDRLTLRNLRQLLGDNAAMATVVVALKAHKAIFLRRDPLKEIDKAILVCQQVFLVLTQGSINVARLAVSVSDGTGRAEGGIMKVCYAPFGKGCGKRRLREARLPTQRVLSNIYNNVNLMFC